MTKNKSVKAGIVNVTGYAGVELARILSRHPAVELISVSGRSAAGKKVGEIFPHLADIDLVITSEIAAVDIAFLALPHKESAEEAVRQLNRGARVIDLSADFRLRDASLYPEWYGFTHPAPGLLQEAVYGLPELYRRSIAAARLVANPGCYPTSILLALAPALKAGIIGTHIIADSKSGISGSGRSLSLSSHYVEANEDVAAYALEGHRHLPEIQQEVARLMPGSSPVLTFVPHLIPMTRGILSTIYAPLSGKLKASRENMAELRQIYKTFYQNEPFVRISDVPPHTGHTCGSNMCLIYPSIDWRAGRMVVVSVLDNLVKGAAGQAVQNMNLMLGLDERTGLEAPPLWP